MGRSVLNGLSKLISLVQKEKWGKSLVENNASNSAPLFYLLRFSWKPDQLFRASGVVESISQIKI